MEWNNYISSSEGERCEIIIFTEISFTDFYVIFSFLWYLWVESLAEPRGIGSREAWRCGGLGVFWWRLRIAKRRRS